MSNIVIHIGLNSSFQDELRNAIELLNKLAEQTLDMKSGRQAAFGFVLKFTANQMNLLITTDQSFRMCNTERAVQNCWYLFCGSYIITLLNLTSQFFTDEIDERDRNENIQKEQELLKKMINSSSLSEDDNKTLKSIKNKINIDKGSHLVGLIKKKLKKNYSDKKIIENQVGFIVAINVVRNYYAHYPPQVALDDEKKLKKNLPFIRLSDGKIDIYPEDIYLIAEKYCAFLGMIENVTIKPDK